MIYVQHGGQQLGPFTPEQAQQYLAMGQLSPQALAVQQGGTQWLPLAQLIASPAAPTQPSAPIPGQPYAQPQQPMLPSAQPYAQPQQPMLPSAQPYAQPQQPMPSPQPVVQQVHIHNVAPQAHEIQPAIAGTVKAGYICMGISLLCLPPFLGLAAFILGIINCVKGQPNTTHGIIQLVGSIICALIGMAIGVAIAG